MSASQYSAATLSADNHLRADLLHSSEKKENAMSDSVASFQKTSIHSRGHVPLIPGSPDRKKQHIWNLRVSKNLHRSLFC